MLDIFLDKKENKKYKKEIRNMTLFFYKKIFLSTIKNDVKSKKSYIKRKESIKRISKSCNYPKCLFLNKKLVVYTALYGNYDTIKPIKTKNNNCDYFIFTDQIIPNNCGWVKKDYSFPKEVGDNPVLKNRFLKMHPHLLFDNYDYSIYIDSTFEIVLDIYRLMGRMGEKLFGLYNHSSNRKDTYEEAFVVKKCGKALKKSVDELIQKYKDEGFPQNYGFFECCIIVRKHNDVVCKKTMDLWWSEFLKGPKRDQLSFMYCLWKNNLSKNDVSCLGLSFKDDVILKYEDHLGSKNSFT